MNDAPAATLSRRRAAVEDSRRRASGTPVAPVRSVTEALVTNRALWALAMSILCLAAMHVAILLAHAVLHRDAGALNLFTMLDAQRLWPALATGTAARGWSLVFGLSIYGAAF